MPFFEVVKLALASILSHKLRSFLTLLGVIFGVATVIRRRLAGRRLQLLR